MLNMKDMKLSKLIFLMLAVLLMTSCHSSKHLATSLDGPNPEQARFESVVRNQFAYDALQSKSKYSVGGTTLSGKLCLESGKRLCVLVNAPVLGFEVARVEASQDSVVIVDKFDKMYSVVNLADLYELDELRGHEMEALECIMLGRIYIPGLGVARSRDYSKLKWTTAKKADGTNGNSEGVYEGRNYTLCYSIDATGRLASTLLTMGGRSLVWEYADYIEAGKGNWVPTRETVTAKGGSGKKMSAGIALNGPQLEESTWRDFEPSSSYRKVQVEELINTVKGMMK